MSTHDPFRAEGEGRQARPVTVETDDRDTGAPPEHADDVVEWISDDPGRARVALDHELARPESRQRLTVLRAALDVLGDDGG